MMSLKELCIQKLIESVKQIPPLLQEEIIGTTIRKIKKDIEKDIEKKVVKDLKYNAMFVIEDVTNRIINAHKTGSSWSRPDYSKKIDIELYQTYVAIAEQFITDYGHMIIWNN
jgi:hypothetical protein